MRKESVIYGAQKIERNLLFLARAEPFVAKVEAKFSVVYAALKDFKRSLQRKELVGGAVIGIQKYN